MTTPHPEQPMAILPSAQRQQPRRHSTAGLNWDSRLERHARMSEFAAAGLPVATIADLLSVSKATVYREMRLARAFGPAGLMPRRSPGRPPGGNRIKHDQGITEAVWDAVAQSNDDQGFKERLAADARVSRRFLEAASRNPIKRPNPQRRFKATRRLTERPKPPNPTRIRPNPRKPFCNGFPAFCNRILEMSM